MLPPQLRNFAEITQLAALGCLVSTSCPSWLRFLGPAAGPQCLLLQSLVAAPPQMRLHEPHQQLGLLLQRRHFFLLLLLLLLLLERGQAELGEAVRGLTWHSPKTPLEPPPSPH